MAGPKTINELRLAEKFGGLSDLETQLLSNLRSQGLADPKRTTATNRPQLDKSALAPPPEQQQIALNEGGDQTGQGAPNIIEPPTGGEPSPLGTSPAVADPTKPPTEAETPAVNPVMQRIADTAVEAGMVTAIADAKTLDEAIVAANNGLGGSSDIKGRMSALQKWIADNPEEAATGIGTPAATTAAAPGGGTTGTEDAGVGGGANSNDIALDAGVPEDVVANPPDVLAEFLESDPKLVLNAVMNKFRADGVAQTFLTWFGQNFDRFWGQYLGLIAQQAMNGEVPTLSFVEFIQSFDITQSFFAESGLRRPGGASRRFAEFQTQQTVR